MLIRATRATRGSQPPRRTRALPPRRVIVYVHRLDDGDTWAVRYGSRLLTGPRVDLNLPLTTRWRGRSARQPRAFLQGRGVARQQRNGLISVSAR